MSKGSMCTRCKEWKPFYFFNTDKSKRSNHCSQCRECSSISFKEWHKKRGNTRTRKWHLNNWEKSRVLNAKKRAKSQKLPFNITSDYIKSIAPPDMICPALGIQMKVGEKANIAKVSSPSLDRLIPEFGYVKGNVVVVSNRANTLKRDATPEELMKVAKFYKNIFRDRYDNLRQLALDL